MPNFNARLRVSRHHPLLGVMQTTSSLVVLIAPLRVSMSAPRTRPARHPAPARHPERSRRITAAFVRSTSLPPSGGGSAVGGGGGQSNPPIRLC